MTRIVITAMNDTKATCAQSIPGILDFLSLNCKLKSLSNSKHLFECAFATLA
jgi:hypothetical protein